MFPLLIAEHIIFGFVPADGDLLIANVLVGDPGVYVASTDLLEFVSVVGIRESDIVPEDILILPETSLPQDRVKPLAPLGSEALDLVLFLLLARHLQESNCVIDEECPETRDFSGDRLILVHFINGLPPVAIELEQLYGGESPAVRTGLVVDLIGNLVSNL